MDLTLLVRAHTAGLTKLFRTYLTLHIRSKSAGNIYYCKIIYNCRSRSNTAGNIYITAGKIKYYRKDATLQRIYDTS